MDLASETLTRPGNDGGPEALGCSWILGEYASFSSFSEAWLACARHYGPHAVRRFNLGAGSVVLELAGSGQGRATALPLSAQDKAADLIVARNVLAQVPDPANAVAWIAAVLKPGGVLTFEFPYLLRLIERGPLAAGLGEAFSLHAIQSLLAHGGLRIFDVDELPAQGSLRLFCCHAGSAQHEQANVTRLRHAERAAGLSGAAA